jgi:hypothetical protein
VSREKDLIDAAHNGTLLECGNLSMEDLAQTEDPRHIVKAEWIRELLLGRRHGELDPRGIQLSRARITGELDLDHIDAQVPLVIWECVIDEPLRMADSHFVHLDLSGSHLVSLIAHGLRTDGDLFLRYGFRVTARSTDRAVHMRRAHIGGNLEMDDAQLTNEFGPAIDADGLHVDGSLFLRNGFRATGSGDLGAVRLLGANIGGVLDMSGARLTNKSGHALTADRIRVEGHFFMRDGFQATGSGSGNDGTIWLLGAHIGGNLEMHGALLTNESGPCLIASGMQVDGDLFMADGFRALSAGEDVVVQLSNTRIGGILTMVSAVVGGTDGLLVDVERAVAREAMFLPAMVICPDGAGTSGRCPHSGRRISLDEFTYRSLARVTWRQWLHLIRWHTDLYGPSPYQQLAAAERAAGHDGNARRILIAQQRDLRARGEIGGRTARFSHWLWGVVAGYGYRARRTAIALLLALGLAGGLGWWAGHWVTEGGHHAAERTAASGSPAGTPCSTVEQIGLGIDRGLPLASAGIRARCDLDTASGAGQVFTVVIWLLQALVWALATLALAGYTGLIRKTS